MRVRKNPLYRRLNALGFLCCMSFLLYLFVCLQPLATGHASPFSSLSRLLLLSSSLSFFLALLHNPGVNGQRIYACFHLLISTSGITVAANALWNSTKIEITIANTQPFCALPFETLMSQQHGFIEKLTFLFQLAGQCTAEKLGPFAIGYPQQALMLFILFFLLAWKILLYRPKTTGMFQ